MPKAHSFLTRWNAIAHRAAVIQSAALLQVLFYAVFLPVSLIRRPFVAAFGDEHRGWQTREARAHSVESARRQF